MSGRVSIETNGLDLARLSEFLDMGGPELRDILLAQVQADLARCREALLVACANPAQAGDLGALCKAAHEIKGLSVTLGADRLAETAGKVEQCCLAHDLETVVDFLPRLETQTKEIAATLATLTAGH